MSKQSLKAERYFAPTSRARWRPARSASYSALLLYTWKSNLRAYVISSPPGSLRIKPAPDPSCLQRNRYAAPTLVSSLRGPKDLSMQTSVLHRSYRGFLLGSLLELELWCRTVVSNLCHALLAQCPISPGFSTFSVLWGFASLGKWLEP